ncbi:MAG: hypothetical protein QOI13_1654 [Paraburkholderia sp.]|nr:hypothetical protein [Paraburkholderia sp.]
MERHKFHFPAHFHIAKLLEFAHQTRGAPRSSTLSAWSRANGKRIDTQPRGVHSRGKMKERILEPFRNFVSTAQLPNLGSAGTYSKLNNLSISHAWRTSHPVTLRHINLRFEYVVAERSRRDDDCWDAATPGETWRQRRSDGSSARSSLLPPLPHAQRASPFVSSYCPFPKSPGSSARIPRFARLTLR